MAIQNAITGAIFLWAVAGGMVLIHDLRERFTKRKARVFLMVLGPVLAGCGIWAVLAPIAEGGANRPGMMVLVLNIALGLLSLYVFIFRPFRNGNGVSNGAH